MTNNLLCCKFLTVKGFPNYVLLILSKLEVSHVSQRHLGKMCKIVHTSLLDGEIRSNYSTTQEKMFTKLVTLRAKGAKRSE